MSESKKTILLVDDEQHILNSLVRLFRLHGFETSSHMHAGGALLELQQRKFDLIISDQKMPAMSGIQFLDKATEIWPNARSILLSGYNEFDDVVAAFNAGIIHKFIAKPWDNRTLISQIEEQLSLGERNHQEPGGASYERQAEPDAAKAAPPPDSFDEIVAHSGAMRRVVALIRKVASSSQPILISGETGTGKELVVKAIHGASERRDRKLVAVNCANISEDNLELQLFGRAPAGDKNVRDNADGRITRADSKPGQLGLFALAHRGTLFLDGITAMPGNLQARLLRVIEEREYSPIGSSKKMPFDVRLITSATEGLDDSGHAGFLRQDLLFRLDVIKVQLPPLRERVEDILPLFRVYLDRALAERGIKISDIDALINDCLPKYQWPGNVRELENMCSYIATLVDSDDNSISVDILPDRIIGAVLDDYDASHEMKRLELLAKSQLERVLREFLGRTDSAARFLGVTRMALLKRIRQFGLNA